MEPEIVMHFDDCFMNFYCGTFALMNMCDPNSWNSFVCQPYSRGSTCCPIICAGPAPNVKCCPIFGSQENVKIVGKHQNCAKTVLHKIVIFWCVYLGVMFDSELSFRDHIQLKINTAF